MLGQKATGTSLAYEPLPTTNLTEGTVGWEGENDPHMPFNYSTRQKWTWVWLLSAITLLTPFASSILSPAIHQLSNEFGNENDIVGSMTVSIYLLGYVVSPIFIAPLSEIYGRKLILTIANAFFCVWQIGCALAPNIVVLIIARFFSGLGGAACLVCILSSSRLLLSLTCTNPLTCSVDIGRWHRWRFVPSRTTWLCYWRMEYRAAIRYVRRSGPHLFQFVNALSKDRLSALY